jgi:RHS repeat-associated protein
VTNDGTSAYTWNEFSKMKSATGGGTLIYDAFGRVVEIDSGTNTEIWYTQLGKSAYMNGTTFNYVYVPSPGGGFDVVGSSGPSHFHKDWSGSARITSTTPTTGNGVVGTDRAYAPYGEVYDIFGQTLTYKTVFTGDTQDILAGMYDTPNRELQGSKQGRWLSPDPAGSGWNQYAYATNPNSQTDPSGLDLCDCDDDDGGGDDGGGSGGSIGIGDPSGIVDPSGTDPGGPGGTDPNGTDPGDPGNPGNSSDPLSTGTGDPSNSGTGGQNGGNCQNCVTDASGNVTVVVSVNVVAQAPPLVATYSVDLAGLLGLISQGTSPANNGPQQQPQQPQQPKPPSVPWWMTFKLASHSEPPIQPTCQSAAIAGVGTSALYGPWVEGPLAWAAYFGGNALGIYGLAKC